MFGKSLIKKTECIVTAPVFSWKLVHQSLYSEAWTNLELEGLGFIDEYHMSELTLKKWFHISQISEANLCIFKNAQLKKQLFLSAILIGKNKILEFALVISNM